MNKELEKPKAVNRRSFLKGAAVFSSFMIVPRHVLGGIGYIAPSDQVTLGFIGAGRQAFSLKNSFSKIDKVRILAACDVYKSKLNTFADEVNQFYTAKNNNGIS